MTLDELAGGGPVGGGRFIAQRIIDNLIENSAK